MNKATDTTLTINADFRRFVEELKARVIGARTSAARAVTHDAILLYWDIGRGIVEKQKTHGWGDSVVELVAADLRRAFPEMSGFSPRNVWDMRRFYATYSAPEIHSRAVREIEHGQSKPILRQVVAESAASKKQSVIKADESVDEELLRQLVAEIPWGQNLLILNKLTNPAARLYYLRATARFGWSRNVLLNQIRANAYERAVTEKKAHNFELAVPEHFAEQADEMLKSPYSLASTSSACTAPSRSASWRIGSSRACKPSCSNSATASASSDASTASRGAKRNISLTCFSITASSRRWSPSISRSARSNRSTQAKWIST